MRGKITIIGAGNVGSTCAQRISESELADVVLVDVVEGMPQGKALDLGEAAPVQGHDARITGSNAWEDSAQSDIIIVTAGIARKPGMSRDDLLRTNAGIVSATVAQAVKFSPQAVIIVVSNPLDAMCHVALKASAFPPGRVLGMAGVLDSARMRFFIARALNVSVESVRAFVLGGHGDSMVPLPRLSSVAGIPLTELMEAGQIAEICQRTAQGGAEVVALLKTGSAYFAPASAVMEMAESILKDKKKVLPCAAYLDGQYGFHGLYIGVPVKLGSKGVEKIYEIKLTAEERTALAGSAQAVRSLLARLEALEY
jgi:malate dehydrogenase